MGGFSLLLDHLSGVSVVLVAAKLYGEFASDGSVGESIAFFVRLPSWRAQRFGHEVRELSAPY
jgi:hypothetical protein